MWEYFTILLFIGITCGVYKTIWWYHRHQYRDEYASMSESELWQEKDKLNAQLQEYIEGSKKTRIPPRKLIEKRVCLFAELECRDLLACSPQDEENYKERLTGLLDILVYKEFMEQWEKLSKSNQHPRRTAVYYALARDELIKRYQKQCAALPDNKLTAEYATLHCELKRKSISRGSHIRYIVVREEMAKRHLTM